MSKIHSPLLNFGEAVLAKESGAWWDLGIWMGRSTRRTEHHVGTRTGVIRDKELHEAMDFLRRVIDGPVVRPDAGWESTPGGKACDEERSGVTV